MAIVSEEGMAKPKASRVGSGTIFDSRAAKILLPVLTMVLTLAAWEYAEVYFSIPSYILPKPSEFLGRFYTDFGQIWSSTIATAQVVIYAFAIGGVIGIGLGYMIVTFPAFERGMYPLIVFLQIIPKTITAPVFVTWFGVGIFSKLTLTTFITFFPVLVDSIAGFRSIDPRLFHLSRSMGATRWQTFRRIQFPAALPQIFSGLKIGTVYAITAVIVIEFVGSVDGLGNLIVQALGMMDLTLMFAAILATSLLGLAFSLAVSSLERIIMPWKRFEN